MVLQITINIVIVALHIAHCTAYVKIFIKYLFLTIKYCSMKKRMLVFVVATVSLLLLFNRCMFDDADSLYDGPAFISSLKVYGMVNDIDGNPIKDVRIKTCLLYTSPSPRDRTRSRMPSSA